MLIYNAKIITMAQKNFEPGFIKICGGKIADVGEMSDLKDSISSTDFDAEGLTLYPGFIDSHCHIGAEEDGLGFEGDDLNEATDPCTPQLRAVDMINAADFCFTEAINAGITTVITGMGSANPIGGALIAMKTYGSKRIDKLIIKDPVAIKFALGENPKNSYSEKNVTPTTRMAIASIIREQLQKSVRYMEDFEEYTNSLGTDDELAKPDYDIKCEALIPLLKREIPAHFHCHRTDDIFTAIRIAKEFNLKYTLVHATEGGIIADELYEEKSECIVGPIFSERCKPELKNHTIENAAVLEKSSVKFSICSDHPVIPIQYLPLSAGIAIRGGLSEEEAICSITKNAAEICGISDRVGSIEAGKDADIVGFKGNFYDVLETPKIVILDGKFVIK